MVSGARPAKAGRASFIMNTFTIRDIQNMSGIKAHTLRVWEQRYGLIMPKRKESKHRFYDNDDLKQILRVAYLYRNGYKISRIASFSSDEIQRLALEIEHQGSPYESYINQLIESSIDFNELEFDRLMDKLILNLGFEVSILNVVYPLLEKIGLLWMTSNVIPAQEHFISQIIRRRILVATNQLPKLTSRDNRKIVIFAPKGEMHELPLLFVQYQLKKHGIPSVYFGTHRARTTIGDYLLRHRATHIYFHLITYLSDCDLDTYLRQLCEAFPEQKIVVSGKIAAGVDFTADNLRILKSLEEAMAFSKGEI